MSGFIWLDVNLSDGYDVGASSASEGIIELTNDLGGIASLPSVLKIHGAAVPVAGTLSVGNTLQVNGTSSLTYAPLNLAGGANYVTGLLPISNQVAQNLNGDLSGTTSSATVIKINGTSVSSNPLTNQVLTASNGTTSSWSLLSDANISSSAAIQSAKLSYSDGYSPSLGSSTIQGAIDAIKTQAVATAIQRITQNITLANLQSLGAIAIGSINISTVLPSNTRVLGAEINVTQAFTATGLSAAVATVQSSIDSVGSLITGASVLGTGLFGGNGINQYLSRGGQ